MIKYIKVKYNILFSSRIVLIYFYYIIIIIYIGTSQQNQTSQFNIGIETFCFRESNLFFN